MQGNNIGKISLSMLISQRPADFLIRDVFRQLFVYYAEIILSVYDLLIYQFLLKLVYSCIVLK